MRFIETPVFTRALQGLLDDAAYQALQLGLLLRPRAVRLGVAHRPEESLEFLRGQRLPLYARRLRTALSWGGPSRAAAACASCAGRCPARESAAAPGSFTIGTSRVRRV